MKKPLSKGKVRRGDAFVEEPTGSAPQINLDGKTETPLWKKAEVTNK